MALDLLKDTTTAALDRTVRTKDHVDLVHDFDADADPQTVFYLNPVGRGSEVSIADGPTGGSIEYLLKTLYFWAPKIELTVREKLKTPPNEHGTAQASWNRASFRSKLLDNLMRNTPWIAMGGDATEDTGSAQLTGNYNHDKHVFQEIVTSALQAKAFPLTSERLRIIPNYISETMTQAGDKLQKIQRFAILLPLTGGTGDSLRESMRLVVIGFERKGSTVETSQMAYEAILNRRQFEDQKLDEKTLKVGQAIVQRLTVDYAI